MKPLCIGLIIIHLTGLGVTFEGVAQSPIVSGPILKNSRPDQYTVAASHRFMASWWKQIWWGKHWRREWEVPVGFNVLNLDTTAGGLKPLKAGGGHETKTLRLLGKNGKEYVLRRMDKSVDIIVPQEFKGSFLNDLANDQVSIAHPYGAIVAASLSRSIGILHTNPIIVFVPGNDRLGPFANDFANKLCLIEERPSGEGWGNTPLTGYASDIINSEKLFQKLRANNKAIVDQKAFLKIRLFDILINDWDRDFDQWIWPEYKENGKIIYRPFARDRDQSFSRTDGVALFFLSKPWAMRSLQNLGNSVTDVAGSTYTGRFMDRQFINMPEKGDWQIVAGKLTELLTDSVIGEAVHQLPPEVFQISGNFLYKRLLSRRDKLYAYAMRYYAILSRKVTLTGSDKDELFTINNKDNRTTSVMVQSLNKNKNVADTLYYRTFNKDETKQVNIFGLGGNDQFIFTGKARSGMTIRVIDGNGDNIFIDKTGSVNHHGRKTIVYDSSLISPLTVKKFRYHSTRDTSLTNYHRESFKYDWWMPLLFPAYNPDDGVLMGAGIIYKKQQWGKTPFGWQQSIGGNYAAATGAYSIFYKGLFKEVFNKWDVNIDASYKAPGYVINFYGVGNDTKLSVKDKSFYRIRARNAFINPSISRTHGKKTIGAGIVFNSVKVESSGSKFINQSVTGIDSSVFKTKYFAGANASYTFNSTDNARAPARGIDIHISASYLDNLKEGKGFVQMQSSFTIYYSPAKKLTIAHRTGLAKNIGDYEFYQANTVGGHENLRGYWRTRFTGRSCFYQNTDIRLKLVDLRGYVVRGLLGLYGFFDDGRVWIEGKHSNTLHTGYGGGIYFIPYNTLAINVSYGRSNEVNVFTVRTGFLF